MRVSFLIIFFGVVSIMGTYSGYPVKNAIANSRAVGIVVAGLLGGPLAGMGAGLVSGVHRYMLGGLTINAAFLSCVLQGGIAGAYYTASARWKKPWLNSMILTALLEVFHFFIVVLITRPVEPMFQLVKTIAPPMILTNSIGVGLFIAILETVRYGDSLLEGNAAQLALKITNYTLPHLRNGLNPVSAKETASIILQNVESIDMVTILSENQVLAYSGTEDADDVITSVVSGLLLHAPNVRKAFQTGEIQYTDLSRKGPRIFMREGVEIIIPVKDDLTVVALVVLFGFHEKRISPFALKLAEGLSLLFSNQVEISKVQAQSELLAKTEIQLLQSQINPHFLFNALNTIVYHCRSNPDTARDLLIHLGNYYRSNLNVSRELVPLETEIEHVKSYLKIETARHAEKLVVEYALDTSWQCMLPPLSLQPIVENSVKHGFPGMKGKIGRIKISSQIKGGSGVITISDNGVGIPRKQIASLVEIRQGDEESGHIGLRNVNLRLVKIYGPRSALKILSRQNKGTAVVIRIPLREAALPLKEAIV